MPTYEYKCDKCGHQFEQTQGITSKPLRKCPKCGKPALKRLIGTGAAVLFKGSGFYTTDYRSESYKAGAKSEAPAKAETPPKTETSAKTTEKKETKPAPAPAKKESTGKKEK
jgi:putative FmdB family regulatory protein